MHLTPNQFTHRLADQDVLPADACAWGDEPIIVQLVIHTMAHA
jgi:hypothetical protein